MYIFGAGFKKTSTVTLRMTGQADIKADTTWLTDSFGESMQARFDLKNKTQGIYDVIIETPGEKTLTLPAYFTIEKGERSNPWASLTGRDRFLINRWSTFNLTYGNTANTDALGTILVYMVNDLPGLEVTFPDWDFVLPQPVVEMGPDYTKIRDSVALYFVTDSLLGYEKQRMRIYPVYIPYIPAGSSNTVRVLVKLNGQGTLKMESWVVDPLYEESQDYLKSAQPIPKEVEMCIKLVHFHYYTRVAASMINFVIPGANCWDIIDRVFNHFI
jgi:hypothetical protein